MSVKYGKFEIPSKIVYDKASATDTYAKFVAEPFERGFGHTVGNALRRILLASLEAPAIIAVRIQGVLHEYVAIDGVIEDMINIVLNLKGALLRRLPTEEFDHVHETRILSKILDITQEQINEGKGHAVVTLKDLLDPGLFEIVNPDLPIFTVTKPFQRQVDLRIAFGRGYVPSEHFDLTDKVKDEILVDAAFSPVRFVNYQVENTRVGQVTDFDRLILEVQTDGRLTPFEALSFASQIALKHFEVFQEVQPLQIEFEEEEKENAGGFDEIIDKLCLRIDEIELSVRSTNCLTGANIETIAELVSIPERKMLEFRNFGKKSLSEIKAKLNEMGLHLGMDLNVYGITADNVKDKIRRYQEEKLKKLATAEEQGNT